MSTSSSTLTSVLSALGGTTGIDVTSAVDAILYADRAPERAWQAQQATFNSQATAIDQLQSDASSLSDALSTLQTTSGVLSAASATSSNTSVHHGNSLRWHRIEQSHHRREQPRRPPVRGTQTL